MAPTIYSLPKDLPAPTVDYSNYDHKKVEADENARQLTVVHKATKKTHVVSRKHYENNKDKYDLA
jgi:hypothetical protein